MAASAARRINGSSLRCTMRTVSSSASPRMTEGRDPSVTRSTPGSWVVGMRFGAVCSATSCALSREGSATPPRFSLGGPGSSAAGLMGASAAVAPARCKRGGPLSLLLRPLTRGVGHAAALQLGRPGVVGGGADGRLRRGCAGALQTRRTIVALAAGRWRGLFGAVLGPRLRVRWVVLPRVHYAVIALGRRGGAGARRLLPVHIDRRHGGPARVRLGFHRHLVAQGEFGYLDLVAEFEELGLVGAPEVHHALVAEFHADGLFRKHFEIAAEVRQRAILLVGRVGLSPAVAAWDRDAGDGALAGVATTKVAATRIAASGVAATRIAASGVTTSGIDLRQGGDGHNE